MKIDDVIIQIDPTVATEEELKKIVADAKKKLPIGGKLSKIIITKNKDGGFDVDYSVKNQKIF